jgi:hypothetical protein
MYEDFDRCPHGYIPSSCAECRVAAVGETDAVGERFGRFMAQHKDGQRSGWLTRRTEITAELARLEGYARRSKAQDEQLDELVGELTVLGSLIDQDDVRVRSENIEHIKRLAPGPGESGTSDWCPGAGVRPAQRPAGTARRGYPADAVESVAGR